MTILLAVIAGLSVIVGPILSYRISRRQVSARIEDTPASIVWAESRANVEQQRAMSDATRADNVATRADNVAIRAENAELRAANTAIRARLTEIEVHFARCEEELAQLRRGEGKIG